MPRGGSSDNSHIYDRIGDRHKELQQLYREKVAELEAQMLEIEQAIEPLEPLERILIRLHYFQGFTWEQIALELNYTRRHITRMHGRALEKLQQEETSKCD